MNRRQREVERMVTDLGLLITGWRTNGTSHWRVDVKTPDGKHQRPFTFPCSGHDGSRRYDELGMLRRWRRSVAPELDAAEETGTLAPGRRTTLAESLSKAGVPLRVEPPPKPGKLVTAFAPGTPEAALAAAIEPPAPTPAPTPEPKETVMQTSTESHVTNTSAPSEQKKMKPQKTMTFGNVMRFATWMNAGRLEGYYTKTEFIEHASRALGISVSVTALDSWLKENNVAMPTRPVPVKPKTPQELEQDAISMDIAAIAMAVADSIPDGPHRKLLLAIAERRTAAGS